MARWLLVTLALALAVASTPASPATTVASFEIRTVATTGDVREVLSSSTVTTPVSASIRVTAEDGPYRVAARFVTREEEGDVRIAARVETRRSAGRSARGLELYEEDVRSEVAWVANDGSEALAVYPFGRDTGGEVLSIEISPVVATGKAAAPEIRIDTPGQWVRVEVETVPGAFAVEAEVVAGGRVVAAGAARAYLDETARVQLGGADGPPAALDLTVDRYVAGCESGRVSFTFNLDRDGAPLARGWSGVVSAGGHAEYPIEGWPGGAVLRVRCAPAVEAP
jgi:hypothetical protein